MLRNLLLLICLITLTACSGFKPSGDYSDLRGRVFSLYYNSPLENATVSVPGYGKQVVTDSDGYFELRGLPTEWVDVTVSHISHADIKRPVHIEPMGAKYVELYADKNIRVRGPKVVFERNFDLWTTDLYGQDQKGLTLEQPRNMYRTYPVWSADKQKIAYVAYENSSRVTLDANGVWVMNSTGTMPRRLTGVRDIGRLYHLDWVSGQGQFVFMLQDRIFLYDSEKGEQMSISGNLTNAGVLGTFDVGPVWVPGTDTLLSTAYNINMQSNYSFDPNFRQIYTLNKRGGKREQLTTEGDNYAPAVSHTGERVAYISTVSGHPEIWSMRLDGNNRKQLTFMKATKAGQPRWSADDNYILFTSDYMQQYQSRDPKELWALDLITGKVHMVTNDALHADG